MIPFVDRDAERAVGRTRSRPSGPPCGGGSCCCATAVRRTTPTAGSRASSTSRSTRSASAQAAAVAPSLAALRPDARAPQRPVPRPRHRRAARAGTGLTVALDPRLREIDVGAWQGLTGEQVPRAVPRASTRPGSRAGRAAAAAARRTPERGARAVAGVLEALPRVLGARRAGGRTHGGTARGGAVPAARADPGAVVALPGARQLLLVRAGRAPDRLAARGATGVPSRRRSADRGRRSSGRRPMWSR